MQQTTTVTGQSLSGSQDPELLPDVREIPPDIDPVSGEWTLSPWDIECLAVGQGILGAGGGGTPYPGKLWALQKMKEGKKIRVITPERQVYEILASCLH